MQTVPKSIIVIFFIVLLTPMVDWIWDIDPASNLNENRQLIERPQLPHSLKSALKFRSKFQKYFNDNFGFRKTLLIGNYLFKYVLLGVSPSNDVVAGKNGWLFYAGNAEIEDCRHITRFSQEQLHRWSVNYNLKKKWLEQQGIQYLLVIAPNKSSVYPEYLPNALKSVRDVSALDEFITYMQKNSEVDVIDLRESLISAKAGEAVYFKTDTHWNNYGAFVAYLEIMKAVTTWFPNLKYLKVADFKIDKKPSPAGDLAGMIGGQELMSDYQYHFEPKKAFTASVVEKSEKVRGTFTMEKKDSNLPRATIFRDSFFIALVPFVAENFRSSTYYWETWDTKTPMNEIINRHRPDIVIEEVVERNFKYDDCDFEKQKPQYMIQIVN